MKAAVLRDRSRPMAIEDIVIDKPRGREVLVRMVAAGLCHSDQHVIDGGMPLPVPIVLGHETAGVVEQVGPEVHTVKPGDHVIVSLTFNCGHCEQCHGGNTHRCYTPEAMRPEGDEPRLTRDGEALGQFMSIGGFAEMILVHESGCVAIDRDMPLDRACLLSCGVATGFGAAARTAGIRPGETVAIIGCGGVGLSAVAGAAAAGAGRIIAIDRVASKLAMATDFGATDGLDASEDGVVERVMEMTGGRGVDHALECIGRKDTIEAAYAMLAKGGTATVVGVAAVGVSVEFPAISFMREKRIQGSMMGGLRQAIDIPRYIDLYRKGRLPLDALISRRRPLEEINEGFADMLGGGVARSVIMFDG